MSSQRTFRPGKLTLPLKYLALFATVWGARVWLIQFYSSAVPFLDQWDEATRLIKPWLQGTLSWRAWFETHNEHRILCTRLLDIALLALNGQWDPQLQMVTNAALAAVLACVLVYCGRHFCGARFENLFFAMIGLIFALPYAAENTLAGFQSQVYFLILASVLTIFALGFHKPGCKWWISGVALSFISLFTMGSGVLASAIVVVLMVLRISRSRDERAVSFLTMAVALVPTIVGAYLNVTVEDRLHQHAASLHAFLLAWGKNLSWPFIDQPWAIAVTFLPIIVLGIFYCRRKLSNVSAAEFALVIAAWVIIQAAAIAYGRGGLGRPPAGRYMDVLSIGVIANWVALLVVLRAPTWRNHRQRFVLLLLGLAWLTTIIYGGAHLSLESFGYVRDKKVDNLIEEENIKGFLATGDERYIAGKPLLEIPFPPDRAADLINLLKNPTIRSILPVAYWTEPETKSAFIQPKAMGRLSFYNSKVMQHGRSILFFGLLTFAAAGIPTLRRLIFQFQPALIADVAVGFALAGSLLFVWNLRHADEPLFTAAFQKWIATRAYGMQNFSESAAHGFESLRLNPDDPETLNNLALALIGSSEASERKADEAIALAERACSLSNERNFEYLETLGMTYAEAGRFSDAIRVTQKSFGLASAAGQSEIVQRLRAKIELYTSGSSFRPPQ